MCVVARRKFSMKRVGRGVISLKKLWIDIVLRIGLLFIAIACSHSNRIRI